MKQRPRCDGPTAHVTRPQRKRERATKMMSWAGATTVPLGGTETFLMESKEDNEGGGLSLAGRVSQLREKMAE